MASSEIAYNISRAIEIEVYTKILSIVYPSFFLTTIIAHSILFMFIVCFSPPHLKFLRILLLKTSIFDVLATIINFYVQPRILSGGKENVPVYSYGLCRRMCSRFCFSLYMGWQTNSLAVGISMTYTLYFKFHKLSFKGAIVGWRLFISLFCFYIPCFVSMICAVIIVLRNTLPKESKRKLEVGTVSDINYLEMGRMTLGEIPNQINFLMMAYGIYLSPILAFWFRWKSNKYLTETVAEASPFLRYHTKNVMTGLTIQVLLHFIFYIPMFTLYSYSLLTGTEVLVQQFFLAISPNLAATFDPIINLYYVVPYRNRVKAWFGRQPQVNPIRVASISSSANV